MTLILMLLSATSQAAVIFVPGDYSSIQDAIDAAGPYDRVLIANGVYRGAGNTDLTFNGKSITVQSLDGPYFCVIDCEGVRRGVRFESGEDDTSVLRGLTIRNGGGVLTGGGVTCYQSSPTISDCRFERNVASQYGGAVYCEESDPWISHCVFEYNESGLRGGALCCVDASPVVTNCALIQNFATDLGGAVYCDDYAAPSFRNVTSYANSTDNEGGGFAVGANASPSVINSILFYDDPGEIHLTGGTITVTWSNVAEGWPGQGNIDEYPQFVAGPLGDLYLDTATSPCIDGGSTYAANVWFYLSPEETLALNNLTTRTDAVTDSGIVDLGYHYSLGIAPTSTPTPTPYITQTPTPDIMVIRVPQDYATIQAAVNAASNGYTVLVDDGTYTGPGNRNITTLGKQIVLRSVNGPDTCIIDCQNQDIGFYIHEDETADTVIRGFTIRNGQKTPLSFGGGIYVTSAECLITDCIIEDCTAKEGGGVFCTFPENGMMITDCIIRRNLATNEYGFGGGVYLANGNFTMVNCLIEDNTGDSGGGLGVSGYTSSVDVMNCTITGNHTLNPNRTGGVFISSATLNCVNSIVYGNEFKNYTNNGTSAVTFSNIQLSSGVQPGTGNINADPVFETGPLGIYYLNQLPVSGSPCLDAGNGPAADVCFTTEGGQICLDQRVTDPAGSADSGTVDMGYHYPSLEPQILPVPAQYGTIQAAIDAAEDHDIVLVAPGNYSGTGNWDLDFQGKDIIVRAVDGPVTTRLMLGNAHRGFNFHSGEPVTAYVDGFSFISGHAAGNGGAIICTGSSPSIVNCTFESCSASAGGAVHVTGGSPVFSNCRFNGNTASDGGAMLLYDTEVVLTNCAFWENQATYYGGGVYVDRSSGLVDFRNCTFYVNSADD
ncbi:MAG TPA: right-handed parallel beta-helix repeat-containing protein, partial [bacterium]|nr:right-handed parallel beta-helix repeat-containing protein [bacterium]